MIGLTRIETETEGVLLRGNLHLDSLGNFQLTLIIPLQSPDYFFSFPRTYRRIWEEHSQDLQEFAKRELIKIYKICRTAKDNITSDMENELKSFWNRLEAIPVVSKQEWSAKRGFLKKALEDGYMDKTIYDKTLKDLSILVEEKNKEREAVCSQFLATHFPGMTPLQNQYGWVKFLYEQTEKKHLVVL